MLIQETHTRPGEQEPETEFDKVIQKFLEFIENKEIVYLFGKIHKTPEEESTDKDKFGNVIEEYTAQVWGNHPVVLDFKDAFISLVKRVERVSAIGIRNVTEEQEALRNVRFAYTKYIIKYTQSSALPSPDR